MRILRSIRTVPTVLTVVLALTVAGCESPTNGDDAEGGGPGTFSAEVTGAKSLSLSGSAFFTSGQTSNPRITLEDESGDYSITFKTIASTFPTPDTYPVGNSIETGRYSATFTYPDGFTHDSHGQLVISSSDRENVEGEFEYTAQIEEGEVTIEGSFNARCGYMTVGCE